MRVALTHTHMLDLSKLRKKIYAIFRLIGYTNCHCFILVHCDSSFKDLHLYWVLKKEKDKQIPMKQRKQPTVHTPNSAQRWLLQSKEQNAQKYQVENNKESEVW